MAANLLGDWTQINLRLHPEVMSTLLWGHSIRRGTHQRFLIFKKNKTFRIFWERFLRLYNNGYRRAGGGGGGAGFGNDGNLVGSANGLTPERRKALKESLLQKKQERAQQIQQQQGQVAQKGFMQRLADYRRRKQQQQQ